MRQPNQMMIKTNLYFNTSLARRWIKNKLMDDDDKVIMRHDKLRRINVGNSYITVVSFIEQLICSLIEKAIINIKKDTDGLFTIHANDMENTIYRNDDLKNNFIKYIHQFDNSINYGELFCFNTKIIKGFIDNKFGKGVDLSNDCVSFISYIIIKTVNDIITTSCEIIKFNKRSQLNAKLIISAINIIFNGELLKLLQVKLEDTIHLYETKDEKDESKEKDEIKDNEEKVNADDDVTEDEDDERDDDSGNSDNEEIVIHEKKKKVSKSNSKNSSNIIIDKKIDKKIDNNDIIEQK